MAAISDTVGVYTLFTNINNLHKLNEEKQLLISTVVDDFTGHCTRFFVTHTFIIIPLLRNMFA